MPVLYDIKQEIPEIILDLRYTTKNNYTKHIVSSEKRAHIDKSVIPSLKTVSYKLIRKGFKLVIYDAYRKKSYQTILRSYCNDDKYVAIDSNHCKGTAIDVTLADKNGKLLEMGTDFDDFSEKAWPKNQHISNKAQKNRALLCEVMETYGFKQNDYEWWHFDYIGEQS